jgi:hypothetical protein
VPLSTAVVYGGLLALFLAPLPLGLLLVRGIERAARRKYRLSVPERVIAGFFASGGILLVVASIPLPVYGVESVAGLFVFGAVGLATLWWRERWVPLRISLDWLRSLPGVLLTAGTLALLAIEVIATGSHSFPNANDGSFQSLYLQLLLRGRTLPWTFEPVASIGITYPAGATVWLSLPPLLLGWPIVSSPVALPNLFLSLSVIGAYCWGERLAGFGSGRGWQTGLIFAGFFGLVGSWPRLFVGGSYDFAFSLPLFLTALGWFRPFVSRPAVGWPDVAVMGGVLGVATSMSVAVGETLFLVFAGSVLLFCPSIRRDAARWSLRLLMVLLICLAFVARSLVGIAAWYSYPGHVLSPIGNPPYAPQAVGPGPTATSPIGDLDPFIWLKPLLSPIPVLWIELEMLLAIGLAILVVRAAFPAGSSRQLIDREFATSVVGTTAIVFLITALLSTTTPPPVGTSFVAQVTSEYEQSYMLFICYQAIALVPLVSAVDYLRGRRHVPAPTAGPPQLRKSHRPRSYGGVAARPAYVLVALLIGAAFTVGAVSTAVDVPSYLGGHLDEFSNVTAGDQAALQWAGSNLPGCSVVFAAPYSAAMFINLYGSVRLDFPAYPLSENLSYYVAVTNLTHGIYDGTTRAALLELGITEVFTTGQTSVSYPPLNGTVLEGSRDFTILFQQGDAGIFQFNPGAVAAHCPAR